MPVSAQEAASNPIAMLLNKFNFLPDTYESSPVGQDEVQEVLNYVATIISTESVRALLLFDGSFGIEEDSGVLDLEKVYEQWVLSIQKLFLEILASVQSRTIEQRNFIEQCTTQLKSTPLYTAVTLAAKEPYLIFSRLTPQEAGSVTFLLWYLVEMAEAQFDFEMSSIIQFVAGMSATSAARPEK